MAKYVFKISTCSSQAKENTLKVYQALPGSPSNEKKIEKSF